MWRGGTLAICRRSRSYEIVSIRSRTKKKKIPVLKATLKNQTKGVVFGQGFIYIFFKRREAFRNKAPETKSSIVMVHSRNKLLAVQFLFSRLERVILGQFHKRGRLAVLKQHLWTSKSSTVDLGRNVQAVGETADSSSTEEDQLCRQLFL